MSALYLFSPPSGGSARTRSPGFNPAASEPRVGTRGQPSHPFAKLDPALTHSAPSVGWRFERKLGGPTRALVSARRPS